MSVFDVGPARVHSASWKAICLGKLILSFAVLSEGSVNHLVTLSPPCPT